MLKYLKHCNKILKKSQIKMIINSIHSRTDHLWHTVLSATVHVTDVDCYILIYRLFFGANATMSLRMWELSLFLEVSAAMTVSPGWLFFVDGRGLFVSSPWVLICLTHTSEIIQWHQILLIREQFLFYCPVVLQNICFGTPHVSNRDIDILFHMPRG